MTRLTHEEKMESIKREIYEEKARQALYDTTWRWMSEFIRRRDKGACYTCGRKAHWKDHHAGHFIHSSSLDFDERAIHDQCVYCNEYQSGARDKYYAHMLKDYGQEVIDELTLKSEQRYKPSISELEKIKEKLKIKVRKLRIKQDLRIPKGIQSGRLRAKKKKLS